MNMLGDSVGNERSFGVHDHCDSCCGTISESGVVEGYMSTRVGLVDWNLMSGISSLLSSRNSSSGEEAGVDVGSDDWEESW